VSRLVPFQGRLHGTDNKAVADGVYDLTFNVYDTPTGGTPAWSEAHTQVSVIHGYVNILLGAITPMHETNYAEVTAKPAYDASKNKVDFTTKKYLGISINGGVEMFPRSQLVPSFHAYTANHADHATEADHAAEASNAAKLNNQDASYYAKTSDLGTSNSRLSTIESKFTDSKAKDADKLDGLDSTGFMRQTLLGGYYGLAPNGSISSFVRTTQSGLLPYQSGGDGSVGTSSWPFSKIFGNDIYDNGTLLESKYLGINDKSVDANKLDNIDSAEFLRIRAIGSAESDPNTTTTGLILSKHANTPEGGYYWYIKTTFWSTIGGNAAQHAISYSDATTRSYVRHRYSGTWKAWVRTDNNGKGADSDKLDGLNSTDFLRNTAKAVDADKLDGLDSTYFKSASNLTTGTISTSRLPAATTAVRGATKKNQMSNATNGYFWDKETGFIMQWGYANTAIDGNNTITFPTSFTNVRNVTTSTIDASSGGMEGGYVIYITSIANTHFVNNRNDALDNSTLYYYWQAVGYKAP